MNKANSKALILLLFFFLKTSWIYSQQELHLGANVGFYNEILSGEFYPTFSEIIEYKPNKTILSLNFEPSLIIAGKNAVGLYPLYMKIVLGKKFRVAPSVGGFILTGEPLKLGWLAGLNFEYLIKNKFTPFISSKFLLYYEKQSIGYAKIPILWFGAGFKFNFLNAEN